jgi:hypothetical protein
LLASLAVVKSLKEVAAMTFGAALCLGVQAAAAWFGDRPSSVFGGPALLLLLVFFVLNGYADSIGAGGRQ